METAAVVAVLLCSVSALILAMAKKKKEDNK